MTAPQHRTMKRLAFVCGLLFVACVSLGLARAQEAGKLPLPDQASQARAEKLIRRLFADDFKKAMDDPTAARTLATLLLREAKNTNDDAALRYTALTLARDLAAGGGDAVTALSAIDEIAKHHGIDVLAQKAKALAAAAEHADGKDGNLAVVDAALALIGDAVAADVYDAAKQLVDAADKAGLKVKSLPLFAKVEKQRQQVQAAEKEFASVKPFADKLAKNPADLEASFQLGKYTCLIKNQWDKGLALIAKGSNPAWKDLAQKDLARPKEPKKQVELGDGWHDLADQEKAPQRQGLLGRAYHWYTQALPSLAGLTRIRVQQRIQELAKLFPTSPVVSVASADITTELRRFDRLGGFGDVRFLVVSHDGKFALAGESGDYVRIYDMPGGKQLRTIDTLKQAGGLGKDALLQCIGVSPDNKYVVSGATDKLIKLWDFQTGNFIRSFDGHTDWVRGVYIFPDQKRLLSAADDRTLRIWDLATGQELQKLFGHTGYINGLSVSKDGTRAITGSSDMSARIWDLTKQVESQKLSHLAGVWAVALSPDGKKAVTSSFDNTVRVWDVGTGKELFSLPHKSMVWSVDISPDGRQVVTGSGHDKDPKIPAQDYDHLVRLWDLQTGKLIRELIGHTDQVRAVAYAADGRHLLSAGRDGTIRLWGPK